MKTVDKPSDVVRNSWKLILLVISLYIITIVSAFDAFLTLIPTEKDTSRFVMSFIISVFSFGFASITKANIPRVRNRFDKFCESKGFEFNNNSHSCIKIKEGKFISIPLVEYKGEVLMDSKGEL